MAGKNSDTSVEYIKLKAGRSTPGGAENGNWPFQKSIVKRKPNRCWGKKNRKNWDTNLGTHLEKSNRREGKTTSGIKAERELCPPDDVHKRVRT